MAYTWRYHNYESKSWKNDVFFCNIAIMWSDASLQSPLWCLLFGEEPMIGLPQPISPCFKSSNDASRRCGSNCLTWKLKYYIGQIMVKLRYLLQRSTKRTLFQVLVFYGESFQPLQKMQTFRVSCITSLVQGLLSGTNEQVTLVQAHLTQFAQKDGLP